MKGDFSRWHFDPTANFSGVLHQQGRVRTDLDDNNALTIDKHWQETAARDAFGDGAMVPADDATSFKVVAAKVVAGEVLVTLDPGRVWADGLLLYLAGKAPVETSATYLMPPLQSPDVRDAVVLEVWQESVSAFQEPLHLLEPALGGPDTTERVRVCAALKLMRLGPNDDCSAVANASDDFAGKGKLTVTPDPGIVITGDCPVEAGGGYTGSEHYLYRIEIADQAAGGARFKWSRFNGGLHGRGVFKAGGAPGTGVLTISANDQMVNHCGLTSFYLEALTRDDVFGTWSVKATADATLSQSGTLALTNIQGTWPTAATSDGAVFFRLWDGIGKIADFPDRPNPNVLENGIHLAFEAAVSDNTNYASGDYWTFPVRVAGTPFDPALWPNKAAPQGVAHRRVALAIITWNTGLAAGPNDIDDCRHVFQPFPKNKGCCCTYFVGDGVRSHGDFDSIEEAVKALPAAGGDVCLLPGLHQTNTTIQGLQHVRIRGCRSKTRVMPREATSTDPIFHILDSSDIALEHLDMVTLGGTAILAESSKPGVSVGLEIAGNHILACQNAIRVVDGAEVAIHHNRIRMLDKRGSGVAIYLSADDSLIERNDIRLVPAPQMPSIDTPDHPDLVDPNDPCAKLEIVYINPLIFMKYIDKVWLQPLLLLPKVAQPYRALSGIQIGGGSERVHVSENIVVGGAGNGITLGDGFEPPPPRADLPPIRMPDVGKRLLGQVLGPDGKPVAGAQVTLTSHTGKSMFTTTKYSAAFDFKTFSELTTYTVDATGPGLEIAKADLTRDSQILITMKSVATATSGFAFLYQIAIVGNVINAMGLSGIGLPALRADPDPTRVGSLTQARLGLGNPIVGLKIRDNSILGCLQSPFDNTLRAETRLRGIGGISLGLCDDVAIVDNRIEANGTSAANPTCGIFIQYGEGVDIARNQIIDNGPLPAQPAALELRPGHRGGIVLNMVGSLNLLAGVADKSRTAGTRPRPAARVLENVVDQPAGCALYISCLGALVCNDNSFASELSGPTPIEKSGGTVFIHNIGGTQNAPSGIQLGARIVATAPVKVQPSPVFTRPDEAMTLLPGGNTLFNHNQSRTGAANESASCQVISCLGDLAYQGNQSHSEGAGNLFSNVFLNANTLRAIGNRFTEFSAETQMSLFTVATEMNNTSLNQGDHCIIDGAGNPAMEVMTGNKFLNTSRCDERKRIATLLFKPRR